MAGGYLDYPGTGGGGSGGGIDSINGDTTPAQEIIGSTGIDVGTSGGITTITNEGALDAFTIVQTDTGTDPTATSATSTLTLHNADGTISVAGNSTTNTVTLGTTGLQPTGNYITGLTGDATATGPGNVAITLASVNADIGTFANPNVIQVNTKGLVTAIFSNPVAANTVLAGPTSGASAPQASRLLVAADIPTLPYLVSINSDTAPAQVIAASTGISVATSSGTTTITNTSPASSLTFADSVVNTAGTITLKNDTASPAVSQYYGTDSLGAVGYHNLSTGSGANTSLSNLSAVAVNASLLAGTTNTIDLGSPTDTWAHAYIGTQLFTPLMTSLGATGAALIVRGGLAASAGAGGNVTVTGAPGDSANGAGGSATLSGGAAGGAGGTNESGGAVQVTAGSSVGSAAGATVTINAGVGGTGTATAGASGGAVNLNAGTGGIGSSTSGSGGGTTVKAGSGGNGVAGGNGGQAQLVGGTAGAGSASAGNGGNATVSGGSAASFAGSAGGTVTISGGGGTGTGSGGVGGAVTIQTGTAGGDNTANQTGGSFSLSVGHSIGSAGGAQVQLTAGTGGIGTSTAGASGGNFAINAGTGGAGSSTGGGGGNVIIESGAGGSSTTPGTGGFIQFQTAATTSFTEKLRILAAGGVNIVNGLLNITTAGNGLAIAHGTNCKLGTSTLTSGSVIVANTSVTTNSLVFVSNNSPSGTIGALSVTKTAGTGFTIASQSALDNSTIGWMIVEQI